VCLYTEVEPAKFEKAALRFARYVIEEAPSLFRTQIALAGLSKPRGGSEAASAITRQSCSLSLPADRSTPLQNAHASERVQS